jgi:hypothetical protein
MSRTVRKKNETWEHKWCTKELIWVDEDTPYRYLIWIDLKGKAKQIEINRFHSEKGTPYIPSGFRKDIVRRTRRRDKEYLYNLISDENYEDYSFEPHKKHVMWDWY